MRWARVRCRTRWRMPRGRSSSARWSLSPRPSPWSPTCWKEDVMPAVDETKIGTGGPTRLSFADENDIAEFVATLERYERGELSPDQWRAFRLVRGTYGQRQSGDVQMVRVKI